MAKGNLLLGTAGNSVGDVVMYRREGAQVSRVRVRKIKNPKTDAQSLQRAAFSPVAKFYSPLAIVLERSFEGLSKMKSYNKFLKTNIDLARANGWLLPKGTGFFPLPYQVSKGSLPAFKFSLSTNVMRINVAGSGATTGSVMTMGQLSTIFENIGYEEGSVITLIACYGSIQSGFYPKAYQFELKAASTTTVGDGLPGLSLTVTEDVEGLSLDITFASGLQASTIIAATFKNEVWRRTSSFLSVQSSLMTQIAADNYKAAAIASYGQNAGDPNPLVYLDGDTLEG